MSLDAKQFNANQRLLIEAEIRAAMEVARVNALKEAAGIAKAAMEAYPSETTRKAWQRACTSILVRLERAARIGMPYSPFSPKPERVEGL